LFGTIKGNTIPRILAEQLADFLGILVSNIQSRRAIDIIISYRGVPGGQRHEPKVMSRDRSRAEEADRGCQGRFVDEALLSVCIRALLLSSVNSAVKRCWPSIPDCSRVISIGEVMVKTTQNRTDQIDFAPRRASTPMHPT
jgi:hypothetical protein